MDVRGETLKVLGLQAGRIEEVFGFEPVNIAVKAGQVGIIARDILRGAIEGYNVSHPEECL